MVEMKHLTATEGNDQFYPTPDAIAGKMLAGIDWDMIQNMLEPSAGKGNLVLAAIKAHGANHPRWRSEIRLNIDCIEIDPYLRAILKQNHNAEWVRPLRERRDFIKSKSYEARTDADREQERELDSKIYRIRETGIHLVHDDFLSFKAWRRYHLILMNPPFANGDLHLLKALSIQKDGGAIVCLLNAETLNNPFTETRRLLKRELERHGASITIIEDAFKDAERKAAVGVAIVRVNIPNREEYHSTIWERMEQAAKAEPLEDNDVTDLVAGDDIEQGVQRYQVEVAASTELIREYHALRPYITEDIDSDRPHGKDAILTLTVGRESNYSQIVDMDNYLRTVRLKYWRALFKNEKFVGRLTSQLRDDYMKKIDRMANYDFTLFNIRTVMVEMNSQIIDGVKAAILSLFDKLTTEHSWYPETTQNAHYYNGWATNKAHKIGKKSIIPSNGIFSSYSWKKDAFDVYAAYGTLSDIEKVFDYLSGEMTDEHDVHERLTIASSNGKTRNIPLKYFDVDLYKKGTVHIKYRDMTLVDKMNIYAARNKNWLPPNYGRKVYAEMTTEEKQVIDGFQGADEYAKVLARKDYYLSEPTRSVPLLIASEE